MKDNEGEREIEKEGAIRLGVLESLSALVSL